MALRYGSKSASAFRYDSFVASALRYGSKIGWSSGDGEILTPTDNSYFTFTLLEDDTYSIAAKDMTTLPQNLVLPSTYEGKAVTVVADSGFSNYNNGTPKELIVESVYIPASITTIGYKAFEYCMKITKVQFAKGSNLTTLDKAAFCGVGYGVGCTINLEECTKLTTIRGDNNLGAFDNAWIKEIIIPSSVTTIEAYAFQYCQLLTNIFIPSSVTYMGERIFDGCASLTTVYCEATEKPSGWSYKWNDSNLPVVWEYKG
jgi:hypothetical protein